MLRLHEVTPAAVCFTGLDGEPFSLDLAALIDLSLEGRDLVSGQRRPDIVVADEDVIAVAAAADGRFIVTLASGRALTLTPDRVLDWREPDAWTVRPRPWPDQGMSSVLDYAAFLGEPETQRRGLLHLAACGFVRLTGAPATAQEIETLVSVFGCIRETNYGRIFDVRTKPDAANLADTALGLAPHTDNPYRLSPPEVQVLHCISAAGAGGQSLLVDGRAAALALKAEAPADFDLLATVPARFAWADATSRLVAEAPVIALRADGDIERIRYNPRSFQHVCAADPSLRDAWTRAYRRFADKLSSASSLTFDMAPGDMVVMDNRRVLHGRTHFEPSGVVARYLQGAYCDMDGVYSTLRRLTEGHVERELAGLEALFESEILSQGYGEDISIRDHMLQSAEGAVARRKGPEFVAAALLHDIGWGMEGPHEAAGAAYLEPRLGSGVSSLIRHHVDAKRYLVATRPDYVARLSPASVETLKRQGGPMTDTESRAFEALPDFEACLELRYLDEGGKELTPAATGFSDFRHVIKTLMIRKALTA